jgi:branched-chain amino acid transport system ATP-binding protein
VTPGDAADAAVRPAGPSGSASLAARPALLSVDGLAVRYSTGAYGVQGVSFEVGEGEIVALLGRNGAGKTTTLRGVAGFLKSERTRVEGSVRLRGSELCGATPMRSRKKGLVLVQERDKVFAGLTVSEHLQLVSGRSGAKDDCTFAQLDALRGRQGGYLSGGERQMLALEMAWRCEPSLLLIDELSLGLAPIIVRDLMQRLRAMAEQANLPILVVEQDAPAALSIADRVYVLTNGVVAWSGRAEDTDPERLSAEYLGLSIS